MRLTLAILGLLGLLFAGSQTLRHIYVRWIEPRGSVLDQYQGKAEQEIAASKPLEELVALYADAKKRVDEEEAKRTPNPDSRVEYDRLQRDPYKSEQQLKEAITERESHHRQLREVHFFWWSGFVCAAIGFVAYFRLNVWFGISLMILGYIEMNYATWPAFRSFGSAQEFDMLLTAKVIYSTLTVIAVLIFWRYIASSPAERRAKPA